MQRIARSVPTLRIRGPATIGVPVLLAAPIRSYSTVPPPSSSSSSSSTDPADAEIASASAPATLAYFVPRTAHGELPVYTDYRNGGSRVLTVIRKTQGNVEALRTDLSEFLATVPSLTKPAQGQIVLRGDWVREVKEWLAARGF